jgi:hypothetical protein
MEKLSCVKYGCVLWGFFVTVKVDNLYWIEITAHRHYFRSQYIGYSGAFLFYEETYQYPDSIRGV